MFLYKMRIPSHLAIIIIISTLCHGSPSPDRECSSEGLAIVGGNYTLTNGMKPRSMLTYNCPEGHYPFPSLVRYCANSGRWNPPPRRNERAECKLVTCPDPLVFEYGSVSPTQLRYYVNNQTTYECFDGYKFVGSATRVCQPNGKWSGSTPICDRSSAVCPDPGVPAGSRRGGNSFDIDDKVTYCCDHDMVIVGSSERVCQESGEWTGTEPACYCELLNTNRTTRTQ